MSHGDQSQRRQEDQRAALRRKDPIGEVLIGRNILPFIHIHGCLSRKNVSAYVVA